MTGNPTIVKLTSFRKSRSNVYLHPFLKNIGPGELPAGTITGKQTSKDGTVKSVSFYNSTALEPGETTKLILQVFDAKSIKLTRYTARNNLEFELNVELREGLFGWSLK